MNNKELEIYEYAKKIYETGERYDANHKYEFSHTERCVEVPWVAEMIKRYNVSKLLDIGFTFASHDYLKLIMDFSKNNILEGMDIIKPDRVLRRYPDELINAIKDIKVYINDVSLNNNGNKYDMVSMISTLEHIGFDKASEEGSDSVFEREKDVESISYSRDDQIEEKVLYNISEMLEKDGICLISVPIGSQGGPILLRDSLGLYTCEWEYSLDELSKIKESNYFECIEERWFINKNEKWIEINNKDEMTTETARMKEHAVGVACIVLKKR